MTPLTLSPEEVEQAKTGKVTLARPVEPQPDEDGLSFHKFWETWFDTSEKSYLSPFGKVGDEFWVREEWRVFGWMDDSPHMSGVHPRGLRLTIEYQPETDENETGRSYYPDSKDYDRIRSLVTSYEDECRVRDACKMPQWASRYTLIHKGTTVEKRDGQWVFIGDMEVKK